MSREIEQCPRCDQPIMVTRGCFHTTEERHYLPDGKPCLPQVPEFKKISAPQVNAVWPDIRAVFTGESQKDPYFSTNHDDLGRPETP